MSHYNHLKGQSVKLESVASQNWTVKKIVELFPDAKTITDAKQSIGILVTPADIKKAKPGDPSNCAVACAVRRQIKGLQGALINKTTSVLVWADGSVVRYHTPVSTYAKILAFDMAGKAEPGLYTLSRVPRSLSMNRQARAAAISATHQRNAAKAKAKRRTPWNTSAAHAEALFQPSRFRAWGVVPGK